MAQFYQRYKYGIIAGLIGVAGAGYYFGVRPELKQRKMKSLENEMDSLLRKGKEKVDTAKDIATEKTQGFVDKVKDMTDKDDSA